MKPHNMHGVNSSKTEGKKPPKSGPRSPQDRPKRAQEPPRAAEDPLSFRCGIVLEFDSLIQLIALIQ